MNPDSTRARLLLLAQRILAFLHGDGTDVFEVIIISTEGTEVRLRSQPGELENLPSPRHRRLRTIEQAILNAATKVPQTTKQLAAKAGYKLHHHFRTALKHLADDGFLLSDSQGGYYLPEQR